MPLPQSRAFLLLSPLLALAALSGCAGPRQPPAQAQLAQQQQRHQRLEALAAGAYRGAESASLGLALQQWVLRGETLPVSLAYPVGGKALPLIVYLPGLGESAQAGAQWRQAWARAGYAVLSLQPLDADARAWSSELARAADFKSLARQHQQPALLAPRLRMLDAALAEARRRAAAGDALWSRVDFERLAVVGHDLGSMAALQWGGAQLASAQDAMPALPRPRAVILLSPVVRVEEPGPLAGIGSTAVLSISSRQDSDPAGLLAAPAERLQSFELMPPGDKRLLLLDNGRHALFAGTPGLALQDEELAQSGSRAAAQQPHDGGRRRQQNSQQQQQQRPQRGGAAAGNAGARTPGDSAPALLAIESVSLAFLDARLRGSAAASAWLDEAAGAWLQGLAQWRSR